MSVTIKDIAKRLGIASSTVSKGLNGATDISEDTRQLVLDTAIEMGYAIKKIRKQGKNKFCILIENMDYESIDQFGYDIVKGFQMSCASRNQEVDIIPACLNLQTEERYDTFMLRNGYSGAFLLGFSLHDDWVGQLAATSMSTVLLDNYIEGNPHVGYVGTDNFEGMELAVRHLQELGHRNIAFLNGSKNSMVSEERSLAFVQGMAKQNLPVKKELIEYGYYVPDCAKYHVPNFIANGATAIVCASDLIASGVINESLRRGLKVPENMSVIGFDNLPLAARLNPPLTTIGQDRLNLGKSAFLLLEGLTHSVPISKILLRASFVKRSSTAPNT